MRRLTFLAVTALTLTACTVTTLSPTTSSSAKPTATAVSTQDEFDAVPSPGKYTSNKPNIVVVLADDQRIDSVAAMRKLNAEIAAKGVTFSNAHAPTSTCCPARSSILTGKLAQGTGVWTNWAPNGGFVAFYDNDQENSTIAARLDEAGYRTALVGKYLNGYGEGEQRAVITGNNTYVPPGWDVWHAFAYPENATDFKRATAYFGYSMLHQTENYPAQFSTYGSAQDEYSTTVLARLAVNTIATTPADTPLFMYVTPYGPHAPYTTTTQYKKAPVPNANYLPPGFAETVGKPSWVKALPEVSQTRARNLRERQIRTLYPVDDAVGEIVNALRTSGRLENTLFVYASDNGYTWGEFNIAGMKNFPYTTPVPMMMRWDKRLPAGVTDSRLVANIDITATALEAAGVPAKDLPDAINLTSREKRDSLVVSAWRNRGGDAKTRMPAYCGLRTSKWLFVRYDGGFEELYDTVADKAMLNNIAGQRSQRGTLDELRTKTRKLCTPTPPDFSWRDR